MIGLVVNVHQRDLKPILTKIPLKSGGGETCAKDSHSLPVGKYGSFNEVNLVSRVAAS
uniref:Uncharacterized protein n=1 Tax=Kalanchoe fedtschenkoi TaxID=63787 RepID=A0A7N0VG49_KALFE